MEFTQFALYQFTILFNTIFSFSLQQPSYIIKISFIYNFDDIFAKLSCASFIKSDCLVQTFYVGIITYHISSMLAIPIKDPSLIGLRCYLIS